MSIGDLTATLEFDTSNFVGPCIEAADVAEQSGERVIRIIEEQHGSWLNFTTAVVGASGRIIGAFGAVGSSLIDLAAAKIESDQSSAWLSASVAAVRYGTTVSRVVGLVVPQWKLVTLAIGGTALAYQALTSQVGQDAVAVLGANGRVADSITRMTEASTLLRTTITRTFDDATQLAGTFAEYVITNWTPLPQIGQAIGEGVATGIDQATSALNTASTVIDAVTVNLTAMALAGANGGSVQQYIDEAIALRQMGDETARIIALQETQQTQFRAFAAMQESAVLASQRAEELATISAQRTLEDINATRTAYQDLFRERITSGEEISRAEMAHQQQILNLIESQAAAIAAGRVQPTEELVGSGDFGDEVLAQVEGGRAAANMFNQMTDALNRLKFGQEEAARLAIMASDATDDEVIALLALHDETVALAAAQAEQKQQQKLLDDAERERQRELARQPNATGRDTAKSKASLLGSSETASIFLRGLNGTGPTNDIQKKSLNVQEKILEANEMMVAGLKQFPQFVVADF